MNILITICARGGSKGIPGKNIKYIDGKSLIAYSINIANDIAHDLNAIVSLSTDSLDITQAAKDNDLHSNYERPSYLAGDKAGKIDTIKDLLEYEEKSRNKSFDYILDLDVTSPLRTKKDIMNAYNQLRENQDALTIFSVSHADRNPYFNMVEKKDNGFYDLVKKNHYGTVLSRQSAPKVYNLNASFYWYKRAFFDLNLKSPITDKTLVFEMDHICFDLDHPIDFDFLEYLISNNKLDFELNS